MPTVTKDNIEFMIAMLAPFKQNGEYKIGARHSQNDQEMIQSMHDQTGGWGAKHKKKKAAMNGGDDSGEAKHWEGEDMMTQVQGLHDTTVDLGALCSYADDAPLSELTPENKALAPHYREAKSIQDAPNLRTKWAQRCENCTYYQKIVAGETKCEDVDHSGYACVKHDFQPDPMWVCDDWTELTPEQIQSEMQEDQEVMREELGEFLEAEEHEHAGEAVDEWKAWRQFLAELKIAAREDVSAADKKRRAGEASHFADPVNKRYKLDTETQIRAAWNYIHQKKNAAKYSAKDVASIKKKIVAAWKKKIDKDGPLSAEAKSFPEEVFEVKSLPNGRFRLYQFLWGDMNHSDLSPRKDYFHRGTNFMRTEFPLPRPVFFHHALEAKTNRDPYVGMLDIEGDDEWGKWGEGEWRKADNYDRYVSGMMREVKRLVENHKLKTSPDGVPQFSIRTPMPNGTNRVDRWAAIGVSVTPTPAEPRMYTVQELKALYDMECKTIGIDFQLPKAFAEAGETRSSAAEGIIVEMVAEKEIKMNESELFALLDKRDKEKAEAETKAKADAAALDAEINKRAEAKAKDLFRESAKRGRPLLFPSEDKPGTVQILSKYDRAPGETAQEQLMNLTMLAIARNEAKSIGHSAGVDEELARAIGSKAFKLVEQGKFEAKALEDFEVKSLEEWEAKASEIMGTGNAGFGADWAVTLYSTYLWEKVRAKARLFGSGFIPEQELPKGFKSDTIQLESTDIVFYNVSQAVDEDGTMKIPVATITSSKAATAAREITIGKLGARTGISGELDEDGIIDAMPEVRRKLEAELGPEVDFVLLNGDTTATPNNINGNGTPTTGADYTTFKGLIRLALKDGVITPLDGAGALTSGKIRQQYKAFVGATGDSYIADNPDAVRAFCDFLTWWNLEGLSDLLTVSNAGQSWATIVQGADPDKGLPVHNVKWYPTAGVKPGTATGIRHSATNAPDGSDVQGRVVFVRGDQWKIRWKRRAKFETKRIPEADMDYLILTLRLGIGYFDLFAATMIYDTGT